MSSSGWNLFCNRKCHVAAFLVCFWTEEPYSSSPPPSRGVLFHILLCSVSQNADMKMI